MSKHLTIWSIPWQHDRDLGKMSSRAYKPSTSTSIQTNVLPFMPSTRSKQVLCLVHLCLGSTMLRRTWLFRTTEKAERILHRNWGESSQIWCVRNTKYSFHFSNSKTLKLTKAFKVKNTHCCGDRKTYAWNWGTKHVVSDCIIFATRDVEVSSLMSETTHCDKYLPKNASYYSHFTHHNFC